jgi:hypothetical protein
MATIILKKGADGIAYNTNLAATVKPGDTVILKGDYKAINLGNIQGTKDAPITFINSGPVNVGGYPSYTAVLNGQYFRLISDDGQLSLGRSDMRGANALGLGESSNVEVCNIIMQNCGSGILQNPHNTTPIVNQYFHNNLIFNLNNPDAGGRSEAFYLGWTGGLGNPFVNCRIEDNLIEDTTGDGIQCANGEFYVKRNIIRNYAQSALYAQRNGILFGAQAYGIIEDNTIEGGRGNAIQILGKGNIEIAYNHIQNIDVHDLLNESIIYINGRDGGLVIDLHHNTFSNVTPYNKVITNATSETLNIGMQFRENKGLKKEQILMRLKDLYIPGIAYYVLEDGTQRDYVVTH